jgi:hypothetical protein
MRMNEISMDRSLRKSFLRLARKKGFEGRKQDRERSVSLFLEVFNRLEREENQRVDEEAKKWVMRQVKGMPVYFAQVPESMLRSMFSRAKPQEVFLYLLLHTYARRKNLKEIPRAEVSEETLAKYLGSTVVTVSRWLQSMEKKGWIQIIRRGSMQPNFYDLYCVGASEVDGRAAMARVQIRLRRDWSLYTRLSQSLHQE